MCNLFNIMKYIIVLISLLLYLFAPNSYSWTYCMVVMAVFISNYLLIYKNDHDIGFNLFFAVAFWSVSFVFPVFVYPINNDYSLFRFGYNADVITKATSLSQFAYSLFSFGFLIRHNVKGIQVSSRANTSLSEKNIRALFFFSIALFLVTTLSGGYKYFSSLYNSDSSGVESSLIKYIFIILNLTVSLLCMSINSVEKNSLRYGIVVYSLAVVFSYLIAGSRTFPIAVLLILSYIILRKRMRTWQYLFVIVAGVILFSLVGSIRSTGVTAEGMIVEYSNDKEWYDYLLDMIVANRNLYDSYEYVQENSITYGLTFMGNVLAVIPFAQSIFCNLFGIPGYALTSATFITYLMFGKEMPVGLGTHIVGDVYMGSGLIGIIVLFPLLGWIVSYSLKRMEAGYYRWSIVYLLLLSDAVFMCRGTMLEMLRSLVWTQLFISIFGSRLNSQRLIKKSF